jgi:hypothetical protein
MPGTHPPVTLHLQPHALPAMRTVFEDAIAEVRTHVERVGRTAFIPEPWLGDPISGSVQEHYNSTVMNAPEGPYAALVRYVAELIAIRDNLKAMEDNYLRNESDTAGLAGRA